MQQSRPGVVLIVDDDDGSREVADLVLSQSGFMAFPVKASRHACDMLEKMTPAAVVLDINMPEMSGLDLLAWMKRRGIRVPVVMVTASGDRETVSEAFRAGAADFLLKPFEPTELVKRVRQALAAPPPANEAWPVEDDAILI
jgi:DNA-binding response OmpR family regulator